MSRTLTEISLDEAKLSSPKLREAVPGIYAAENTPDILYARPDGSFSPMPWYHSLFAAENTRDVYYIDRQGVLHARPQSHSPANQ